MGLTVLCTHPDCFDGARERTRFTRQQVEDFTAAQLARIEIFPCPSYPGAFHTRARRGWRM